MSAEYDVEKTKPVESSTELWDEIGYHKPIAGFWNNLVYTLIGIIFSSVLMGSLIGFFYPYPDSWGMKDVAFGYFSLMFVIFDIGTGAVMGRFIPEVNIKDPEKMLHYVQYFIWYQMITGLIQTTAVSIYALFIAPETTMAYTVWIMLIASTTQYPGFLGVFRNVLDSLQHYNKTKLLNFLTGTLMQNVTSFLFVYIGRIMGEANPKVGPILGIAIGAAIGGYVDDFMAMALSAHFFNKTMAQYGLNAKFCFRLDFTWEEIKPVVFFSLKTGLPGLITQPMSYAAFLITVNYIPQYTTIYFLAIVGGSLGDFIGWFGIQGIGTLTSESYMNNKPNLTQYYIGQDVRFNMLIITLFAPLVFVLRTVMPTVFTEMGNPQYVIAVVYILPKFFRFTIERFFGLPGTVMYSANKPNFGIVTGIIHTALDLGVKYLLYVVIAVPRMLDLVGTIWLIEFAHIPLSIVMSGISYAYVHKKIVKIKIPFKQIIIGFLIPSFLTYLLNASIARFIFFPIMDTFENGFLPAIIVSITLILASLFFVFIPLTAIFGGWDNLNIEEFRKAAYMSGPSKFVVLPMYKVLQKAADISRLHGKFQLPLAAVIKDAEELLIIKQEKREALKEKLQKEELN